MTFNANSTFGDENVSVDHFMNLMGQQIATLPLAPHTTYQTMNTGASLIATGNGSLNNTTASNFPIAQPLPLSNMTNLSHASNSQGTKNYFKNPYLIDNDNSIRNPRLNSNFDLGSFNNEFSLKENPFGDIQSHLVDDLPYPESDVPENYSGYLDMRANSIRPSFPEYYESDQLPNYTSSIRDALKYMQGGIPHQISDYPKNVFLNLNQNSLFNFQKDIQDIDNSSLDGKYKLNNSITDENDKPNLLNLRNLEIDEDIRNIVNKSNDLTYLINGNSAIGYLLSGVPQGLQNDFIEFRSLRNSNTSDEFNTYDSKIDRSNDLEYQELQKEVNRLKKTLSTKQNEIQLLISFNESLRLQLMNASLKKREESPNLSNFSNLSPNPKSEKKKSNFVDSSDSNIIIPVESPYLVRPDASRIDSLSKSFTELLSLFDSKENYNTSKMSTLICFPGGRIASCNNSFLEKLGYNSSSLFDQLSRWEDVVAEEYWGEVINFLSQALKNVNHKRAFHLKKCGVKHRDGTILQAEIIVGIIGGNQSQIPVFVVSYFRFHDQDIPGFEWDVNEFLANFE